ncbi:MAG: lytic transglycosylase domain-containing protein [Syntrophales bacterium]|nr:lytic transglycosylase domain-containing protein [Syntrophales bacterium]
MTPPNRGEELTTDIDDVVAEAARENRLAPSLIRAVIQVESGWNPRAVSPKGAMGLMQLMPETARMLGVKNPFDVRENVLAGTRYLKSLIDRYDGNIELALAAYNWGPGNLERATRSMPQETVQYVAKVKKYWRGTV